MCFSQSTPWTTDVHVSFRLNRPGMGSVACPGRLVSQFLCDSLPTYIVGGRREINRDSIPSEATQIGNYPQKLVPHNFDGKTNLDWMTPLVCIPTMPPFSSPLPATPSFRQPQTLFDYPDIFPANWYAFPVISLSLNAMEDNGNEKDICHIRFRSYCPPEQQIRAFYAVITKYILCSTFFFSLLRYSTYNDSKNCNV